MELSSHPHLGRVRKSGKILGIPPSLRLVIIVLLLLAVGCLLGFFSLGVILLLLFFLLNLAECLPLRHELVGLRHVICDDHIVKNGVALHLPEVESNESEVIVLVEVVIVHELRIRNLLRLPHALVGGVADPLHGPFALVLRVVDHGCFPFTIFLIIPVIGFLGLLVHDSLLLDPVLGLFVLGIVHHTIVHPITRLLILRVFDLLGS
mmetsp:Transcript_30331/g.48829  ORF Transcript_30331/g.48829 Transcript_30331/m.48829 type:complete len:207 (-) Transcript_30331:678-1298(-)